MIEEAAKVWEGFHRRYVVMQPEYIEAAIENSLELHRAYMLQRWKADILADQLAPDVARYIKSRDQMEPLERLIVEADLITRAQGTFARGSRLFTVGNPERFHEWRKFWQMRRGGESPFGEDYFLFLHRRKELEQKAAQVTGVEWQEWVTGFDAWRRHDMKGR
ncbi:hypothetical protein FNJ84_13690 [Paracoccus sp. M683]|uniref:hypothetical protein n=1 Tax=Paracoccus sp. M683 TaxID=2594268 RepID=UPI001180DA90|nr:hypothetical protein [Paracoccus sp. M683]TRW96324.1 hypothetical protein FNJ84_13690 [Paracoccus sp. M683]